MIMDKTQLITNEVPSPIYGSSVESDDNDGPVQRVTVGASINVSQPSEASDQRSEDNLKFGSTHTQKWSGYLISLCLLSAIGGFLFGYDTGVMSGALIPLREKFSLSLPFQELVVSVAVAAAALCAFAGGFLNDAIGRKPVILLASLVFTVGAVVMGAASSKYTLLVGRVIVGMGIGFASMTVPMYIAESAPSDYRGLLVTVNNLFITGGQFIASVVDGLFMADQENGWRFMLGLAGVPSLIQLVGFMFMPESPRWLMSRGREADAKRVLMRIRGASSAASAHIVEQELEAIRASHRDSMLVLQDENSKLQPSQRRSNPPLLLAMIRRGPTRRALLVGCGMQLAQQLAGINTVMYYSATIIRMSGVRDPTVAVWMSAVTAGTNFLFTFVGLFCIERLGRRRLALISLLGVLGSLILLAVGFQLAADTSPPVTVHEGGGNGSSVCDSLRTCDSCITTGSTCGYCYELAAATNAIVNGSCLPADAAQGDFSTRSAYGRCSGRENLTSGYFQPQTYWAPDYCPTQFAWISIIGLLTYLAFFAPGMGPVPWAMNAEIYPLWARSTGIAAATTVNWVVNLIVSSTFLSLTEAITRQGTYWLYSGIVVVIIGFVLRFVPETKGKSLEEMEQVFGQPWC